MDSVTNIVLNSARKIARKRVSYPGSPSHSSVPGRLGSSMPIDGFHGSLAENQAHHGAGREFIKGRRCMYISFRVVLVGC